MTINVTLSNLNIMGPYVFKDCSEIIVHDDVSYLLIVSFTITTF